VLKAMPLHRAVKAASDTLAGDTNSNRVKEAAPRYDKRALRKSSAHVFVSLWSPITSSRSDELVTSEQQQKQPGAVQLRYLIRIIINPDRLKTHHIDKGTMTSYPSHHVLNLPSTTAKAKFFDTRVLNNGIRDVMSKFLIYRRVIEDATFNVLRK
jgi:hypothetical protein